MFHEDHIEPPIKELLKDQLLDQLRFMNDLIPGIQSGDRISKLALNIIEESHERLFRLFAEAQAQEH